MSLDAWQKTFDINVTGPLLGIQALVPLMPAGSSIINICSVAAVSGHAAAAYTASKWALRGLTRSAALELGSTRGIRVNAVMPGLVDTPLMESASPAFFEAALAEVPLGRVGVPADIAPTIVFLVLGRLGVLQRRRARHRRRSHRARLAQGHRGRDQAAAVRLGTLRQGAAVLDDDVAYLLPTSLAQVIELGLDRALEVGDQARHGEPVPFSEADLLLPYRPPSIRDFVTFESHVEGVRRSIDNAVGVPEAWYDAPTFYFTNPHSLYGPGEAIPRPVSCRALDFEMEVACVVGSTLRSASEEEAAAAIFGYTILNDWSARDIQAREMQVGLGPAKGKDFATSFGPWIVTADEPHFP